MQFCVYVCAGWQTTLTVIPQAPWVLQPRLCLWGPRPLHQWPVTPLPFLQGHLWYRLMFTSAISSSNAWLSEHSHKETIAHVILLPERKAWRSHGGYVLSLLTDETGTVSIIDTLCMSTPGCGHFVSRALGWDTLGLYQA